MAVGMEVTILRNVTKCGMWYSMVDVGDNFPEGSPDFVLSSG